MSVHISLAQAGPVASPTLKEARTSNSDVFADGKKLRTIAGQC